MPLQLPGPYNVFIPGAKASGNLVVDFSRNINDFALLKYCQLVPTDNTLGIWYQMGLDQRARVVDADLAADRWADGTYRPKPNNRAEYFQEKEFRTKRYSYADTLGWLTSEQATWDEKERRSRSLAQEAMTKRTNSVLTKLLTSSEYASTHVFDMSGATGITGVSSGVKMSAGTAANPVIKRCLNWVKKLITLDTRAAVKGNDLTIVMGPQTAEGLSVSQEIVELVKQSVAGLAYLNLKDGELFPREDYGLPRQLYNCEYIIEDTVKVTTERGYNITQTGSFAMPSGSLLVLYKPNSLTGVEGGRSFSTVSLYVHKDGEMKLETKDESFHRLTEMAITDDFDVQMTAPVTGALFTNVL